MFKMITLPKMLYALQNTYYPIPLETFAKIEGDLRSLIWQQGHPRIALRTLFRNSYNGGIALPDIRAYYLASHLVVINEWCHLPQHHPTYSLERKVMGNHAFYHFLCGGGAARLLPATQVVIKAWIKAMRDLGWWQRITQATPLWQGNWLKEIKKLTGFKQWDAIGISTIGDLLEQGKMMSFESIRATYQMSPSQQYKYLRIRHAWQAEGLEDREISESAPLEGRLLGPQLEVKAVSWTYRTLNNNMPDTLHGLRSRWETDTKRMEDIDWEAALMHPREVAIKSRLRLIQLKILHRSYYDRKRLHTMGRADSTHCLRCNHVEGSFMHTLWSCPRIQTHWELILRELSGVVEIEIPAM
mgnify:CR=1 FL=1